MTFAVHIVVEKNARQHYPSGLVENSWLEAVYYVIRTAPLLGPSLSPFFALHGQQPRNSGLLFEPSDYDFCRKIHYLQREHFIYCQTFLSYFLC